MVWVFGVFMILHWGWFSVLALIYMVFCLYWIGNTISNIVHVVHVAAFTSFYFDPDGTDLASVSWTAFKRACSTSLGSIAYGSLFMSCVKGLITTAKGCNQACCCVMSPYHNSYGFTQVAMHGKDFSSGSKTAFHMFSRTGVDRILENDITWVMMKLVQLSVGFLCIPVTGLITFALNDSLWVWAIIGFIVGLYLAAFVVAIVESAVMSLFVCLADDPHRLSNVDPVFFQHIQNHYRHNIDLFDVQA